jgi:hypothetical protein
MSDGMSFHTVEDTSALLTLVQKKGFSRLVGRDIFGFGPLNAEGGSGGGGGIVPMEAGDDGGGGGGGGGGDRGVAEAIDGGGGGGGGGGGSGRGTGEAHVRISGSESPPEEADGVVVRLGFTGGGGGGTVRALKSFSVIIFGIAANWVLRSVTKDINPEISSSFWVKRSMVRDAMS